MIADFFAGFSTEHLLVILYLIGIIAEAMTAAVAAGRMRMDLFGVITLGALTALGGGTVRDVVLGTYPVTWVEQPLYLLTVIIAAAVTVRISWLMVRLRRSFLVADAIGLATFAVLGIQTAVSHGHGFIIACVAAVTTGVFGGVLRDVLSDRVPLVFHKEMYASAAVIGVMVWWGLDWLGAHEWVVILATLATVLGVRLLSLKRGWSLPVYEYDEEAAAAYDPRDALTTFLYQRARRIPGARTAYRGLRKMRLPPRSEHRRPEN